MNRATRIRRTTNPIFHFLPFFFHSFTFTETPLRERQHELGKTLKWKIVVLFVCSSLRPSSGSLKERDYLSCISLFYNLLSILVKINFRSLRNQMVVVVAKSSNCFSFFFLSFSTRLSLHFRVKERLSHWSHGTRVWKRL